MSKTKARFVKLKDEKFYILNGFLYGKDLGGILLNCLLEDEAKQIMKVFHKGDCGGHHYWNERINKILRSRFYWPTMFSNVHKEVVACHECQIFDRKRKLLLFPLKLIFVEEPF